MCRCTNCEAILDSLDKQIARSNSAKEYDIRLKKQVEDEVRTR